jgi:hypothetical protein
MERKDLPLNLRVASYNCRGMNFTKLEYIKNLLILCDILFIQEHWLTEAKLHELSEITDNFLSYGVCGFEVVHTEAVAFCGGRACPLK